MPVSKVFSQFPLAFDKQERTYEIWKSLKYLNYYRAILAGIFITSIFLETNLPMLGSKDETTFAYVGIIYFVISTLGSWGIRKHWPSFEALILFLTLADIICLTLIMHTSGGINSGLGMLILVAIAGNSLLIASRTASLFAAIAALAILFEQTFAYLNPEVPANYTKAGILGLALFVTALLSQQLSMRVRESEALAERRALDLANLTQLNSFVINRFLSGVIVLDPSLNTRLMNNSALDMLGLSQESHSALLPLWSLSRDLETEYQNWKTIPGYSPGLLHLQSHSGTIDALPSFQLLGQNAESGVLIFLEDVTRTAQQAQQLKLASLGRLTASIAHEIRNPLGAISYAEQLLAESKLSKEDKRLVDIIHTHTERVNHIIENILQLSRRGNPKTETVNLHPWLKQFLTEFQNSQNVPENDLELQILADPLNIQFDPSQLQQILWNLCHNGIRFSSDYPDQPKVQIVAGYLGGPALHEGNNAYIDVIDHGPGISEGDQKHIFEPFFTTDNKGTGLGLYIARELCQLNQAHIIYIPHTDRGSCFRLELSTTTN